MKNAFLQFPPVLIALLIATISLGQPTTNIDTTGKVWIKRASALKVLAAADSAKVYKDLVRELKSSIDSLHERIKIKNQIVEELKEQDSLQIEIITSYQDQIAVMEDQRKIFEQELKYVNKQVKKYKRRLWWRTAGGLVGLGALGFLYFTK